MALRRQLLLQETPLVCNHAAPDTFAQRQLLCDIQRLNFNERPAVINCWIITRQGRKNCYSFGVYGNGRPPLAGRTPTVRLVCRHRAGTAKPGMRWAYRRLLR